MLEAAAGAKEWTPGFTREADRRQRAIHAAIRTGRHTPQAIEWREAYGAFDLVRGDPFEVRRMPEAIAHQPEGQRNRLMSGDARIVIADQRNGRHVCPKFTSLRSA